MTSKRRSLSELAAAAKRPTATDEDVATPEPVAKPEPVAAPATEETPATQQRPRRRRGQPPTPARFDEFERKETRLRADQYEQLTLLSRQLNRQRRGRGQRITENTLIRIGIDLLLAEAGKLAGATEDELRDSVATKEPN